MRHQIAFTELALRMECSGFADVGAWKLREMVGKLHEVWRIAE